MIPEQTPGLSVTTAGSAPITFPDLRGVAWIPFFWPQKNKTDKQHYFNYARSTQHKNKSKSRKLINAFHLLFFSGNQPHPPDNVIQTKAQFDAFCKKKNYRAVLALWDIHVVFYPSGSATIKHKYLNESESCGYTPYRAHSLAEHVIAFSKGEGKVICDKVENDPDGLKIAYTVCFRIGWLGNLVSKLFSGFSAPFANMRVYYYVMPDGKARVLCKGSVIPNQKWFLSGKLTCPEHKMLHVSEQDIEDFIETPGKAAISNVLYKEIIIHHP